MKLSPKGAKLIQAWEGIRLKAYLCPAGKWTIGYGHTGPEVKEGMTITIPQAETLFAADVAKFEEGVNALLPSAPWVTQGQFDALVSFAYNLGLGQLGRSTLLKLYQKGDLRGAAEEFLKWNKIRNPKTKKLEESKGLTARRRDERARFLN
jgi:lysozyme